MSKIKEHLSSYIKDDNKFKLVLFSIIFFPGVIQWILIILSIFVYRNGNYFHFFDHDIYYNAVNMYRNGNDFYNDTGFLYPPISIIFFFPFGYLPLEYSRAAFLLLSIIILFLTTIELLNILKYYSVYTSTTEKILLFISIFLFDPIRITLSVGQVNIVILFILTISYYYIFVKKEKTLSSIYLTIGTAIKIYPIFFLILEVFNKNVKGLTSKFMSFMIMVTAVSIIIFGITTHLKFMNTFMNFQRMTLYKASDLLYQQNAFNDNVSITNIVIKILSLFEPSKNFFDGFLVFWSILKILFLVSVLYFVYTISLNKNLHDLPEWEILIYSTLLILPIIISNVAWIYFATFLITSYILFIYVFELDFIQKQLLFLALMLHSTQHYIVLLVDMIGCPFTSIVYIVGPVAFSYILFLIFVLYSFRKIKVYATI